MEIVKLTQKNLGEYEGFPLSDEAENVGRKCYLGLMAIDDDRAVGVILWKYHFRGGKKAEDEVVFFDAKGRDYAQALLKVHDKKIKEDGIRRTYFEMDRVSDEVRSALEEAGFALAEKKSRDIIFELGDRECDKIIKNDDASAPVALKDISDSDFWNGTTYCLYNNISGLMEDLDTIGRDFFDADTSCCIRTDGFINGLFLIHALPSGSLLPVLLFYSGKDQQKNLLRMIRFSLSAARKKYPENTGVILRRHNDLTYKLTEFIFPGREEKSVIYGERSHE